MMDFFRKIPADLTETTITGAALSVAACIFMGVLFIVELYAFLSTTVETGVMLDTNSDTLLRINFNVTMLDLQCADAVDHAVDKTCCRPVVDRSTAEAHCDSVL